MRDWPAVGVLGWAACLSHVEEELDPGLWIETTDDLYIADTRADYEAMGLVVFQAREIRYGLEALRPVIETELPSLFGTRPQDDGLAILRLVHATFPDLLQKITTSGRSGEATLDGLRWALRRGQQLAEAKISAGYSWTPYATGGGDHEHVLSTLSSSGSRWRPVWRDAGHQCDPHEPNLRDLREDVKLMQGLLVDLARVVLQLSDAVVAALADAPLVAAEPDLDFEVELLGRASGSLEEFQDLLTEYLEGKTVLWRTSDGEALLSPPPLRHLLDERVRSFDLEGDVDTTLRPPLHTCGVVFELPECDWCGQTARIDGWALDDGGQRVAGFMCEDCFLLRSERVLGVARGGYMFKTEEVPPLVRNVCNELCRRQGRPPVYEESLPEPDVGESPTADAAVSPADERLLAGLTSMRDALAEELSERQVEAEEIAAGFKVTEDGKFSMTQDQHRRYVRAVKRASVIKKILDTEQPHDARADAP